MRRLPLRACLFDLDGTLVNSEAAVIRAWSELLGRHGLDPEVFLPKIHGRPASESIAGILAGLCDKKTIEGEVLWLKEKESTDVGGVVPIAGSIDFLHQLNNSGIPWAIVTSGALPVASARMNAAGIPQPGLLITSDDIVNGKPDPEPYLLACEKLGIAPEECIVFEDASAGIKAGLAAGCPVVGIAASQPVEEPGAISVIQTYESLSIQTDINQTNIVLPD